MSRPRELGDDPFKPLRDQEEWRQEQERRAIVEKMERDVAELEQREAEKGGGCLAIILASVLIAIGGVIWVLYMV